VIVGNEGSAFHQVARWIAAHREFGKKNQTGGVGLCATSKVYHLRRIAAEITDRGINLAQRNLHTSSVKRRCSVAKSQQDHCISGVSGFRWDRHWADPRPDEMASWHLPARGWEFLLQDGASWEHSLDVLPDPWPR
jgi:hypothetical protein